MAGTMLNEGSQTQKGKYFMLFVTHGNFIRNQPETIISINRGLVVIVEKEGEA